MKPVIYTCARCEFEQSNISTWGSHNYKFGDQSITIDRRLALCYSCDKIVSAELLPQCKNTLTVENNRNIQSYDSDKEKRIIALANRKSAARCLNCGSHDFEFMPNYKRTHEQQRLNIPVRTGIYHKNCGGRIYADFDTPNLFMGNRLPKRYYNIEGERVE